MGRKRLFCVVVCAASVATMVTIASVSKSSWQATDERGHRPDAKNVSQGSPSSEDEQSADAGAQASLHPQLASLGSDRQPATAPREVVCDLAVVQPGSEHECGFVVNNDTSETWYLRQMRAVCRCTRVLASSESIPAGSDGKFTVHYRAPPTNVDDVRTVGLDFVSRDSNVHVSLTVRAKCRSGLTVVPVHVRLPRAASPPDQFLVEVHNFTDNDWSGLEVIPDVSSLSIKSELSQYSIPEGRPRQSWRLSLVDMADPDASVPDFATVEVRALPTSDFRGQFHVYFPLRRGKINPQSVFFGRIRPGDRWLCSCPRMLKQAVRPIFDMTSAPR